MLRMKIKYLSSLLPAIFIAYGCQEKQNNTKTSIEIALPNLAEKELIIEKFSVLNYDSEVLEKAVLDPSGNLVIEIEIKSPTFANLSIESRNQSLFLNPQSNIHISSNQESSNPTFLFSGTGSTVNNYLAANQAVWDKYNESQSAYWALSRKQFVASSDSVKAQLLALQKEHSRRTMNKLEIEIIEWYADIQLVNLNQQYDLINGTERQVGDTLTLQEKRLFNNGRFLDLNMLPFAQVLDLFLRAKIHEREYQHHEDERDPSQLPKLISQTIQEDEFEDEITEFLLAKNIEYWLASEGITPSLDSILEDFKISYPNSTYHRPLNRSYAEWASLLEGRPAPEITGLTISGDTVSLSDLRGKKIYVDVWATWCAPCLEEFPFYSKLQKELEKHGITYLFVSVDQKSSNWTNFLAEKDPPPGIHIIELPELPHPDIHSAYKIWGIPRYILVDEGGRIIHSNAPRPSSLDQLTALLQDGT